MILADLSNIWEERIISGDRLRVFALELIISAISPAQAADGPAHLQGVDGFLVFSDGQLLFITSCTLRHTSCHTLFVEKVSEGSLECA
jgi:hypothetical protein